MDRSAGVKRTVLPANVFVVHLGMHVPRICAFFDNSSPDAGLASVQEPEVADCQHPADVIIGDTSSRVKQAPQQRIDVPRGARTLRSSDKLHGL